IGVIVSCRDIKGANLLVDVNGVVKLADFGMAKHVSFVRFDLVIKQLSGAAPANSLKGSPFWMAPELSSHFVSYSYHFRNYESTFQLQMLQATMNKETGYDLSVDIWSLGCTIIEMFTGKHPWNGLEGVRKLFY
ncbi:hypothetical protein BHE74_00039745, partial [Ensete ventricosum]